MNYIKNRGTCNSGPYSLVAAEYGPLLDVVLRAQAKVVHFDKKKFAGKH